MLRLLLLLLLAAPAAMARAEPPPLEAYGRLPAVEDLELSPEGDRIAYITVSGEDRKLVVKPLNGPPTLSLNAGSAKVRDLAWAGPNHLLITTSTTAFVSHVPGKHEWSQVVSYNLATRTSALLLHDTRGTMNAVLGTPIVAKHKGEPAVFVRGVTTLVTGSFDLYRVDLDSGRGRIQASGTIDTAEWIIERDGSAVARMDHDDRAGKVRNLVRAGNGWRALFDAEPESEASFIVGLGRKPGELLISRSVGDRRRLFEWPITGGDQGRPLDDGTRIMEEVAYDPASGRPVFLTYLGEQREYVFLEPQLEKAWARIRPAFKGSQVSLRSWSSDFKRLIVMVEGSSDAGTFYLVDVATNKADMIADAWPGVPPAAIAPVRNLTYKAGDGLEIPAYLTLPVGREAKNLPLIVLPHGGPEARDEPGFDWWAQALASRGYAVLQPQFRGSAGFGRKFVEAGHGQWGRKMQSDLSDGVRHLAKEGIVDSKRVCIMGASYGGYAALAGATLEPDVYRCAVSVAGVSDLPVMLKDEVRSAGGVNRTGVRYWAKFMGTSFQKRGELDAVSPAAQAARAGGPILLIHGKDDTVVPFEQSEIMHRALKRAGKPVEFVTLAAEDHWLSRGATRLEMLKRAVSFVEKHNPPN